MTTIVALRTRKLLPALLLGILPALASCQDASIVGRASVVDGDTLEIHGMRIRLEGVDAPESRQQCARAGVAWRCGQAAAMALSDYLGARPVACTPRGADRYGRTLARCIVDGVDVQAWLVGSGWALAYTRYSNDYAGEQTAARTARVGVWQADTVEAPWEWRAARR